MRRICTWLLLCSILCCFASNPAISRKDQRVWRIKPGETVSDYFENGTLVSRELISSEECENPQKIHKEAGEGECELRVSIKFDPAVIRDFKSLEVFNLDGSSVTELDGLEEDNTGVLHLEKGIYNIVTVFIAFDGCNRIILSEKYPIDGDVDLELDASVCVNKIEYRSYNPEGERFTSKVYKWDDSVNDYIPTGEENTYGMCASRNIVIDGVQMQGAEYEIFMGTFIQNDGVVSNSEDSMDIYINDVSEHSGIFQTRFILADEGRFLIFLAPDGCKSQTVRNNPEDYKTYSARFRNNFAESPADDDGYRYRRYSITLLGNFNGSPFGGTVYNLNCKYKPGEESSLPDIKDDFWFVGSWPEWIKGRPKVMPEKNLLSIPKVDKWGRVIVDYYNVTGSPMCAVDESKIYPYTFNIAHDSFNDAPYHDDSEFSFIESFSYSPAEVEPVWGNAVPVLEIMNMNALLFGGEIATTGMLFKYQGRFGEIDDVALAEATCTNEINGEAESGLLSDMKGVGSFSPNVNGKGVITIKSGEIPIEDMAGLNTTDIHWKVEGTQLPYIPTLRMLQFQDSEGKPTDCLTDSEAGQLCFSAGIFVFNANLEPFAQWFDLSEQPMETQVEYAPYASGNWQNLEVTEDESKFQMPGWGFFYRSSLKDLTAQSETGWYDIRITMKADEDNYQVQTLSPAFKIESSQNSVNDIIDTNEPKEYFDLLGNRVGNPVSGLFIVKQGAKVYKRIFK